MIETGIPVFFADPHSPWRSRANGNTNALLRRYFPKGTDVARRSADDVELVATVLSARPLRTLGWRTPDEALRTPAGRSDTGYGHTEEIAW
jgi:IS30 family transposase